MPTNTIFDEAATQLDLQALVDLNDLNSGPEEDILAELIQIFETSTPERMELMGQALLLNDAELMNKTAHSLKGSSGSLGARRFAQVCLELEEMGRSKVLNEAQARKLLLQLQVLYKKTFMEIREAYQKIRQPT